MLCSRSIARAPSGWECTETYADRKNGLQPLEFPEARTEEILKDTYGVIVYQEQVMRIANLLAGFSLAEADHAPQGHGEEGHGAHGEVREALHRRLRREGGGEGQRRSNCGNVIVKFAEYGFNKSHSAAYAVLTWRTAWLKANYPVEFFAANMTCESGDTDKIKQFVDDARRLGVALLAPDVNRSERDFSGRVGLDPLRPRARSRGWGRRRPMRSSRRGRKRAPSSPLPNYWSWPRPGSSTKRPMEALVGAGAFDSIAADRGRLFLRLESILSEANKIAADRRAGQKSLFGLGAGEESPDEKPNDAPGRARRAAADTAPEVWSFVERLARERASLGFYLSGHRWRTSANYCWGPGFAPLPTSARPAAIPKYRSRGS